MKLAEIAYRDLAWLLEDDTETNPPVGTIVLYEDDESLLGVVRVYFPGYGSYLMVEEDTFHMYFTSL